MFSEQKTVSLRLNHTVTTSWILSGEEVRTAAAQWVRGERGRPVECARAISPGESRDFHHNLATQVPFAAAFHFPP